MLGVGLGLISSVAWGISDFLGGLQSRRMSPLEVLLVSQPLGAVLAFVVALAFADRGLEADQFLLCAAAGAVGAVSLGAFYKAMAIGSISVSATIGTLALIVPVVAGLIRGETPDLSQGIGAVVATAGVLLVTQEPEERARATGYSIFLASLAAVGIGFFLLILDQSASHDVAWTIVAARIGGITAIVAMVAVVRPAMVRPRGAVLASLIVIAFCDVFANTLFAVATTKGLLPLVAVAGSLYSGVTVLLAWRFLDEPVARIQLAGLAVLLVGVLLIAAGA